MDLPKEFDVDRNEKMAPIIEGNFMAQKLQSLQDKKHQSQRYMDGWAKRNEQLRVVIEKSQAEMEDRGQKNPSGITSRRGFGHGNQRLAGREREEQVVVHHGQIGAVLIQPWWSSLSRWEQ